MKSAVFMCHWKDCENDTIEGSIYCEEHHKLDFAQKELDKKVIQMQKDSFPTDSFWLYQLQVTKKDGSTELQFALPNDYANQDTSSEIIFYDIIVGDSIYERGFLGCSVIITKRMFFSFDDIHMLSNLTVIDKTPDVGQQYVRASRVLRSLPGIRNTSPISKK